MTTTTFPTTVSKATLFEADDGPMGSDFTDAVGLPRPLSLITDLQDSSKSDYTTFASVPRLRSATFAYHVTTTTILRRSPHPLCLPDDLQAAMTAINPSPPNPTQARNAVMNGSVGALLTVIRLNGTPFVALLGAPSLSPCDVDPLPPLNEVWSDTAVTALHLPDATVASAPHTPLLGILDSGSRRYA